MFLGFQPYLLIQKTLLATLLVLVGCGGKNFDLTSDIEIQTDLLSPVMAVEVSAARSIDDAKLDWKTQNRGHGSTYRRRIGYKLPLTSTPTGAQRISRGTYSSTHPEVFADHNPVFGGPVLHKGRSSGSNRGEPGNIIVSVIQCGSKEIAIEFLADDVLRLLASTRSEKEIKPKLLHGRWILFERTRYIDRGETKEDAYYDAHPLWTQNAAGEPNVNEFKIEFLKLIFEMDLTHLKKGSSLEMQLQECKRVLDSILDHTIRLNPVLRLEPSRESHVIRLFINT